MSDTKTPEITPEKKVLEYNQQISFLNKLILEIKDKMKQEGFIRKRGCPKKYFSPEDIVQARKRYYNTWKEKQRLLERTG